MKIIGGSFGLNGSAYFSGDSLVVDSVKNGQYEGREIDAIDVRVDAERKFGVIGAVVGILLFGALGMAFFGVIGAIGGVGLAIAASFYSTKKNIADVKFSDGRTLSLECTPRAINRLVKFGR